MNRFCAIFFSSFLLFGTAFAQDAFVVGFEDLPLMNGLISDEEEMSFDTLEGRIIESHASSNTLSAKSVLDFYTNTLPQLGWSKTSHNTFIREGEELSIETAKEGGVLDVKFFLQPTSKGR